MSSIRINVSIPQEVYRELSEIEPRKRSRFITEAVKHFLKERREKKLAAEYQEAAEEMKRINQEIEGVTSDGLD
jgi:metal-responsive CopG/Arc/MetJ family transcriptional regulator